VQHHSSAHSGPEAWRGKRAVIIGANKSAHDIAQALWEHDAQVTMVQRSSTLVVKAETLHEHAEARLPQCCVGDTRGTGRDGDEAR
jgi:putative flavoprotein involved in K+ transport